VPRYGGSQEAWEHANLNTFPMAWARFLKRVANWDEGQDLANAVRLYYADWTRFLFSAKGLTPPDDDEQCAAIGEAADRWINPQIVTLFAGVEQTVRILGSRYRLFTASDGFSASLAETLRPIAGVFERLYGPDLVNVPKSAGRRYYDAVFAHAQVDPSRALVLDDNLSNIESAHETGAITIYVKPEPDPGYRGRRIGSFAQLPQIIEAL
jgi:putative hydrolase of the HAD superfamily